MNLLDWLTSTEFQASVEYIRSITDKEKRAEEKGKLPCITPSALLSYRSQEKKHLIKLSGMMQFDVDAKENPHITDFAALRDKLGKIPNMAFCGLSASGKQNGCWGLLPIAYPDKHHQHFDALARLFKQHFNIILDTKPRNVSSLRGASYDPDAVFNHQAIPFGKTYQPPKPRRKKFKALSNPSNQAEMLISAIVRQGVDVTKEYDAWYQVGCTIANTFGENGREYFHLISQFCDKYTEQQADRQFDYCLKKESRYSIGTLVKYCREAGIDTHPPTTHRRFSNLSTHDTYNAVW